MRPRIMLLNAAVRTMQLLFRCGKPVMSFETCSINDAKIWNPCICVVAVMHGVEDNICHADVILTRAKFPPTVTYSKFGSHFVERKEKKTYLYCELLSGSRDPVYCSFNEIMPEFLQQVGFVTWPL